MKPYEGIVFNFVVSLRCSSLLLLEFANDLKFAAREWSHGFISTRL